MNNTLLVTLVLASGYATGCATGVDRANVLELEASVDSGTSDSDSDSRGPDGDGRPDGEDSADGGGFPGDDDGTTGDVDSGASPDTDADPDGTSDDEPAGPQPLIDDLEDANGAILEVDGRAGWWFTSNDGTPGGEQMPAPDTGFFPRNGGPEGSNFFAGTNASGFTTWGAGMGLNINHTQGQLAKTWDATDYTGIRFDARGAGSVRVNLTTTDETPPDHGGSCNKTPCGDSYGASFTLTPEWTQYELTFDDAEQVGWGAVYDFDPSELLGLRFMGPVGVAFEIEIDNLEFF